MAHRRPSGTLRIIGGQWRSRQVHFDPTAGLRPTPDRVRQTLFDWLAPVIDGVRCLDLYAGSGALGLEALSRGAGSVDFVETGPTQLQCIRTALEKFDAEAQARLHAQSALTFLSRAADAPFDVVFVDPPFDSALLEPTLAKLPAQLAVDARVYVEWRGDADPELPPTLQWLRKKKAGQVSYGLASNRGAPA